MCNGLQATLSPAVVSIAEGNPDSEQDPVQPAHAPYVHMKTMPLPACSFSPALRERSSLSACLGALFIVSVFPFITHLLKAYYVPATGESKQIKQTRAVSSVSEEKEQGAQFGVGLGSENHLGKE